MRPFDAKGAALLAAIQRGEFVINGFRNRDIHAILYSSHHRTEAERRRRSNAITRHFRMLRAHSLIRKVPKTHRYQVSDKGRILITAILALRQANTKTLTAI